MFATGEMEEKPTLKNRTKIISQIEDSGWSVRLESLWPLCELASTGAPTCAPKLIIFILEQFWTWITSCVVSSFPVQGMHIFLSLTWLCWTVPKAVRSSNPNKGAHPPLPPPRPCQVWPGFRATVLCKRCGESLSFRALDFTWRRRQAEKWSELDAK